MSATTERWQLPEDFNMEDFSEYVAWMMPADHLARVEGVLELTDPSEQVRKRLRKMGAQLIAPEG